MQRPRLERNYCGLDLNAGEGVTWAGASALLPVQGVGTLTEALLAGPFTSISVDTPLTAAALFTTTDNKTDATNKPGVLRTKNLFDSRSLLPLPVIPRRTMRAKVRGHKYSANMATTDVNGYRRQRRNATNSSLCRCQTIVRV